MAKEYSCSKANLIARLGQSTPVPGIPLPRQIKFPIPWIRMVLVVVVVVVSQPIEFLTRNSPELDSWR